MLVTISRDAARFVRTAARAPKGAADTVQRGAEVDYVCQLRCTLAAALALREWFHGQAEETRPTRPAMADVLEQAAADVGEAITHDEG
jgi:hypothetical protein